MRTFRASVVRKAPRDPGAACCEPRPRSDWRAGDYVLAEVVRGTGPLARIESVDGRMIEVAAGDRVVGALGKRYATLEVTGDWEAIGEDLEFEALTAAGVFGRCTSAATTLAPLLGLRYVGHVRFAGAPRGAGDRMEDFAEASAGHELTAPIVLLIGTSMNTGKTTVAKAIIRLLGRRGLRVGGAKLTGVARYRDILAMSDAGADTVVDFVDAGLPSTICPVGQFETALDRLLALLAAAEPAVVVAEAGASPLEPYNGDAAVHRLGARVALTVLCASDPYAVVGVIEAFGIRPDLVAGRCTSTRAGIALVDRLTGLPPINVLDPASHAQLDRLLQRALLDPALPEPPA